MIQIVPVTCDNKLDDFRTEFFNANEHLFCMEMQDGNTIMGAGYIYIKGDASYLLGLTVNDQSAAYMIVDSIVRSLMNLASHHGAVLFNANDQLPLMNYFGKNEFNELVNFTTLEGEPTFKYGVAIEPFFARPCRG